MKQKRYQAVIEVLLRPGVFDPQGQAVTAALHALGHDTVEDVRVGKLVRVVVSAESAEAARTRAEQMCRELLANPVLENYQVRVEEAGVAH